jgi:gluconokinase
MVIVIMGVAGSGKTTVGRALASALGWNFRDADDFHPPANVAKMSAGQPLTDVDRAPWLAAIRTFIDDRLVRHENAVVTCSALKEKYRAVLAADPVQVKLVHLAGDPALLAARIASRTDHFMKPAMLASQLAALEPPREALTIDIADRPETMVAKIRAQLKI